MTNSKKTELRKKAEKILREKSLQNEAFYQESLETLIQELNIYQIELEHQNDELKKIQANLEKTNEQYLLLGVGKGRNQQPHGQHTNQINGGIGKQNQQVAFHGQVKGQTGNKQAKSQVEQGNNPKGD